MGFGLSFLFSFCKGKALRRTFLVPHFPYIFLQNELSFYWGYLVCYMKMVLFL